MTVTQFNNQFYLSQRPDVEVAIANGIFPWSVEDHYNVYGWRELSDPNPQFDTSYYLAANPDILAARINPFQHFVNHGISEGRMANGAGQTSNGSAAQFDPLFYFSQRPDVLAAIAQGRFAGTAEDHYNQYGWREGSDPNSQFDTSYYLEANPDVAAAQINPFQHFVEHGISQGRRGNDVVEPPQNQAPTPVTPQNQVPTAVTLTPVLTELPENTTTRTKLADIVVTDDGIGANTLSLSGADAAQFEIVDNALYLVAGTALDFETKPQLNVQVDVDDPSVGASPDASVPFTLAITDVDEAPTAVALTTVVSELSEATDTSNSIKLADIVVTDDGIGTNTLSLSGADAAQFEIVGNALYLAAGTPLDFETQQQLNVQVDVDDTSVGNTPDASVPFTLTLTDVVETVSIENASSHAPGNYIISDTFANVTAAATGGNADLLNNAQRVDAFGTVGDDFVDLHALTVGLGLNGFAGNDNITGGSGWDFIDGDAGDDYIVGGPGGDTLVGNVGNDTIWGGDSADGLIGGDGADVFVYDVLTEGSATESIDFGLGGRNTTPLSDAAISGLNGDVLRFDYSNLNPAPGAGFATAPTGTNGSTLGAAAIVQGAGAQGANQAHAQFLYDSTTGLLSFDPNGNTVADAAVDIALIGAGLNLTATDFLLLA